MLLAALLLAAALPAPVSSPEARPVARPLGTAERLDRVHERRQELEREIDRLRGEEKGLLVDVERLELQVRLRSAELREIQLTLRRLHEETSAAERRATSLEGSLRAARPAVLARVRALYKLGEFSYLRLLLSVDRPVDVLRAYRFVSALAREDRGRLSRFRRDLTTLEATRAELDKKGREALELKAEVERRRRRLDVERRQKTDLLTSIVERKELHLAFVEELAQAEAQLQHLLAGSAPPEITVPLGVLRGSLPWPVSGTVRVGFGPRRHPKFDTVTAHNGVEIEAAPESPVLAVHDGTVAFAGHFRGYGLMVVLDHGGKYHTLYAHLAELSVAVPEHVAAGQAVGVLSSETPADLYFEVRHQGRPEDPTEWLTKAEAETAERPPARHPEKHKDGRGRRGR